MEMEMSSFSTSLKGKLGKFELTEKQKTSLDEELKLMLRSLEDKGKRAKIHDELRKLADCLKFTSPGEDIFTKMAYVTSVTEMITTATQSSTEIFPVMFHVLCVLFQRFGRTFQQSLGSFPYPSSSSDKKQCQRDPETHAQAVGLENILKTAHAYLNGIEENASAYDIENLQNRVPNEKVTEFLGIIKTKIENLLPIENHPPKTDFESAYLSITYVNIYARLGLLRSVLLWQLYCLKKRSKFGQTSAKSIYLTIKANEDLDLDVIKFITLPKYERRVFLTLFHPSENEQFMNFLKVNSVEHPSLAETKLLAENDYVIRPMEWPKWRMEMGWDADGSVWGNKKEKSASHFQFEPLSGRECDNVFYIRSLKWKNYYVYMRNNAWGFCAGAKRKPDKEGQWKMVQFEINGQTNYVLSPLKWPCYFIYMTNSLWGQVRGSYSVNKKCHDGLWGIDEC
jgi:hypothetical protein